MPSLITLFSCDSQTQNSQNSQVETVFIGRMISGGHLPLAIVEKKYQDELKTFKLETVQSHDWNTVIAGMKSGTLTGTFILSPLAMKLIHEGFPGKIVLMANRNGNSFILSKKIQSIDKLKAKHSIIAVPHIYSQHHLLVRILLKQYNVPEENIRILEMPPRDMINSLRKGEIDGFMVGEPEGNRSVSLGVGWMAAISTQIWKDHMDHVFLASDTFIKKQPERLQELINLLVRGGEFIEKNPRATALMSEDYTGSASIIFEKILSTQSSRISYTNMIASEDDMKAMAEKLVEMKLWSKAPNNMIDDYFDMSFVIKAEQTVRIK